MSLRPVNGGASAEALPLLRTRYIMLGLIFLATTVNYIDRAVLSVAAPQLTKELALGPVQLGLLFSAFAWTYALANLPGGVLVDLFGSRWVYGLSQLLWSAATFTQGVVGSFAALFGLRMSVGLFEAPAFPANNRVVALWFPQRERGLATSTYVMGQYLGTALFTPLFFWLAQTFGWRSVFWASGGAGIALSAVWFLVYRDPRQSRRVGVAELDEMRQGGALIESGAKTDASWRAMLQLFRYRQVWAICLGKFCIYCSLYFFLTWFPTYLIQSRGLTLLKAGIWTMVPYLAASVGVLVGGYWSDWLLRRGASVAKARKWPIVTGFLCASTIALANYTHSAGLALAILTFAFFAQGVSSTSWAIVAEVAPRELIGVTGGICNFCGNLAGVFTPVAIGYILRETGSFQGALALLTAAGIVGAFAYTVLLGPLQRIVVHTNE
jgi:ACS family D-galactonate transporter-like MFS transporter